MENIKTTFDIYLKNPTEENRNEVIKASIPAVTHIVNRFQNGKIIEKNDLFQEGILGILNAIPKAVNGEDFYKKVFSYIKAAVLKYGNNQGFLKLNTYTKSKIDKVNNFIQSYKEKNEEEPSDKEISEALHINLKNLCRFKSILSPSSEINEFIKDENDYIGEMYKRDDFKYLLNLIKNKLTKLEQSIIEMKYGIGDKTQMTLEEIGVSVTPPLCKQRIDQIHKSTLSKLKKYIK